MKTELWAVSRKGTEETKKCGVVKETPKTYVLDNGMKVRKENMSNKTMLFYVHEDVARKMASAIKSVYFPEAS